MKRAELLKLLLIGCVAVATGCEDDITQPSEECGQCSDSETCKDGVCMCGETTCSSTETCVNGTCKPNEKPCEGDSCNQPADACNGTCSKDETCVNGTCKPNEKPCEGDSCDQPADPCNGTCSESETCSGGKCMCGDKVCSADQVCSEDECITPDPCKGTCRSGETCDAGVCKCGESTCTAEQVCEAGTCKTPEETGGDDTEDGEEEEKCTISCPDGTHCSENTCIPITPTIECATDCAEDEFCDPLTGTCTPLEPEACSTCTADESCSAGVCLCGTKECAEDEICKSGECKKIDPCADLNATCAAEGKVCMNGACIKQDVSLGKDTFNVMFSSKTKITATKTAGTELLWSLDAASATEDMSYVRCLKVPAAEPNTNPYSKHIADCIDKSSKTAETVTFLGLSRLPRTRTLKVQVKGKEDVATATLNLKPYFDLKNFVKMNYVNKSGEKVILINYKNGICPGYKLKDTDYNDKTESTGDRKANLGGLGKDGTPHDYGVTTFTDEQKFVFDSDMYTEYVKKSMIKVDGEYKGTRASVVAAARFLILQFPYDIPYAMGGTNKTTSARSHYVWAYHDSDKPLSQNGIYGLNLSNITYSSATNHGEDHVLKSSAIPWGSWVSAIPTASTSEANYENSKKYKFNGLECSGFVSWAFRNGHLGLGDWTTRIFAKDGFCVIDGKVQRNYKCDYIVNHDMTKLKSLKDKENGTWSETYSNLNNYHTSAFKKLNKLTDSDFIALHNYSTTTDSCQKLYDKMADVKAGDILWRGHWMNGGKTYYRNGHIAMIVGLKRNTSKKTIDIYVGEAVQPSGNKLRKLTLDCSKPTTGFMNATNNWVKPAEYASFIIKMDKVYNYYSSEGNTYKYEENFSSQFDEAIFNH